jgi:hypothetical protein
MKRTTKIFGVIAILVLSIGFLQSCKNKNPSVVKIFVRSASNELVVGAKVVLIGDPSSNPATMNYVDTVITNDSGFAYFNVQPYYDAAGEENTIAYFDVIAKTSTKTGFGYIRSRVHTTAVETVFLPN